MSNKRLGMVLHSNVARDIRVTNEINFLSAQGYEIFVLIPFCGYEKRITEFSNYTVVQTELRPKLKDIIFGTANSLPFFNWYWNREISTFIIDFQLEILHAHDLYMGEPALSAATKMEIPAVIDLHENFPVAILGYGWVRHPLKRLVARAQKWKSKEAKILAKADGIITLSDPFGEKLRNEYAFLRPKPMAVYPNVPNVDEMLGYPINELELRIKGFCLLYFGMIAHRRGLHTASAAVRKLNDEGIGCTLIAIGNVDTKEGGYFENEVLNENVVHIPWIDLSELRSYVAISDVCISPLLRNDQHESGVANKIFQYMLYERPLLVSDCKPQKDIVDEFKCGLSHESENVEDFAAKVRMLVKNKTEAVAMGLRGKEAVLKYFNTEVQGKNIDALYKEILSGKP